MAGLSWSSEMYNLYDREDFAYGMRVLMMSGKRVLAVAVMSLVRSIEPKPPTSLRPTPEGD